MKIIEINLIILFICIKAFSQDSIAWKPSCKLQWVDFRGTIDKNKPFGAVTSTGIFFRFSIIGSDFRDSVVAMFYKRESWVRISSSEGLIHEQGHFDISEIYARRLRKKLKEYTLRARTLRSDLNIMYYEIEAERNQMEELYDKETNHSRNAERQVFWNGKIQNELKELEMYAK